MLWVELPEGTDGVALAMLRLAEGLGSDQGKRLFLRRNVFRNCPEQHRSGLILALKLTD